MGADRRPGDGDYRRFVQLVERFKDWEYDQARMARNSPFRVYDVLFNAILHRANRDLLDMARGLEEPTEEIQEWLRTGRSAFEEQFWCPEDRMYHSRDVVSGDTIPIHTGSCALPL